MNPAFSIIWIITEKVLMIQCRLREMMAERSRDEPRRITYDVILANTGISKSTLSRMSSDKEGRIGVEVMNRLCQYFDCQPGDLFVYVKETS
jgi:putative transcriptional regulator